MSLTLDHISTGCNESLQHSHMHKDTRFTDVEHNFTITSETVIQMLSLPAHCRPKYTTLAVIKVLSWLWKQCNYTLLFSFSKHLVELEHMGLCCFQMWLWWFGGTSEVSVRSKHIQRFPHPIPEKSKARLDGATWPNWRCLLRAGMMEVDDFQGPFQPTAFHDLWALCSGQNCSEAWIQLSDCVFEMADFNHLFMHQFGSLMYAYHIKSLAYTACAPLTRDRDYFQNRQRKKTFSGSGRRE